MKFIILFFALIMGASSAPASEIPDFPKIRWSPNPLYTSEGFRLGYIIDVKWEGILIWTFEGQMTLGVGTGPDEMVDRPCMDEGKLKIAKISDDTDRNNALAQLSKDCQIFSNPWKFSFLDSKLYGTYKKLGYIPVVIYYARLPVSPWRLVTKTDSYVYEIFPTDETLPVAQHYEIPATAMPIAKHINPESGFLPGRVVKASLDHVLLKTYEVVIQEGVNGNNFSRMSVSSSEMFDHLVQAMLTGKVLRIGFVRLFAPEGALFSIRGYDTYYRVTSVDIIPEKVPNQP